MKQERWKNVTAVWNGSKRDENLHVSGLVIRVRSHGRRSMAKGKDRNRKADIAACILAGGKNSRMNGRKKAFLPVEETVFWKKIAAKLSGCSAIYISVEDRKKYEQTQADVGECGFEGFPLVEDLEKEKGPLGGIYSVLTACEEQAVLFVPCDMPEVDQELVDTMRGEWVRERKPVFLIRDGKRCPFPGIYTKEMLPWIRRQLERKIINCKIF